MGVKEAQKAVDQAQAAYSANKDKALKKALKAAKAVLAEEEAKQALQSKKRKVEETPVAAEAVKAPKKKKAVEATPVAPEPVKTPKKKKAEAVPEVAEAKEEKPKKRKKEKGLKVDITALREAVKNAKVVYKADKTIDNKAKLKAAKTAVKAAEALVAEWAPATPVAPPVRAPAAPPSDTSVLATLKSNAKKDAAAPTPKGQNNDKCNRVFVGNLPFTIDDDGIKKVFQDCGTITKIAWIEDKTTGRFKGCGVMEFDSVESAEKAVALDKQEMLGRQLNIQYSTPRGDNPSGDANKKQSSFVDAPLSEKPEGCTTCFVGNLSFAIEEDDIRTFAEDCGEIKAIRWVHHKDTGDFKGCGFVEFHDSEAADKFIAKKGVNLKGRPIRIDWSSSARRG